MSACFGGGLHLGQSLPEVSVPPQNSFECLPGAARNRIGVLARCSMRNLRRYARVSRAHRRPVAEIPRFEFFYRNPRYDLSVRAASSPSGSEPGTLANLLESQFELLAVVAVAIHDHHDSVLGWHPVRIPLRRFPSLRNSACLPGCGNISYVQCCGRNLGNQASRNASMEGSSTRNSKWAAGISVSTSVVRRHSAPGPRISDSEMTLHPEIAELGARVHERHDLLVLKQWVAARVAGFVAPQDPRFLGTQCIEEERGMGGHENLRRPGCFPDRQRVGRAERYFDPLPASPAGFPRSTPAADGG